MKTFVIMPYGGDNPEKVKEYNRVFRFMIAEAVHSFDPTAEVFRQDYTGQGGQILRNVISNIAEADLVIADISDRNWNVAYELGLRHVLNKYGTLLLCNDETELPYDISQLNVIVYPTDGWLDRVEELTEQIAKHIAKAMQKDRSDSPVFDIFPALPANLAEMLSSNNDEEQRRIIKISEELEGARAEVKRLRQRIEDVGLDSAATRTKKDLKSQFSAAIKNRVYNSDEAVAKLRELADEKDYEGFADFLAKVLEFGYLSQTDCRSIYVLCRRVDIPDITRIFIESAVEFYPENEELQAFLANVYSQDYHNRDKALSIVNESMGISRKDGKYELAPKVRSARLMGTFFDVYIHLGKFSDIVTIGEMLLQAETHSRALICRNICIAALKLEDYARAKKNVEILLEQEKSDDRTYYTQFLYLDAIDDQIGAYMALENCIRLDPEDIDYYFAIAGSICDERIARVSPDMEIKSIDGSEREKYAAPFVIRAFLSDPRGNAARVLDFFRRNRFNASSKRILSLVNGEKTVDDLLSYYDFSIVDYCLTD